jgi:Glycosyl hydrolase family 3 C-terminal domain
MSRYITSDCDAVKVMQNSHGYAKTPEDAVAYALKAGINLHANFRNYIFFLYIFQILIKKVEASWKLLFTGMDVNCGHYVQNYSASALQQGKIAEADMDRALHNLFSVRMRLGLFNGNPTRYVKYGSIGPNQVCSQEHQNLAMETALQGIVLLKNTDNLLPLSKQQVSSLGVIGPNANNAELLVGNYHGPPCFNLTPLATLQGYIKDTRYVAGCNDVACNTSITIDQAVQVASSVDYVVLFVGLDQNQESEDLDRYSLLLPGAQQDLISSVAKAAKKPVILVLLCGGPVDVSFAKSDPKISAILWAGYPGQAGGPAIAQVLFGEHNPGFEFEPFGENKYILEI